MIGKTQGIVLGYIPYGETSIIVRIYTSKYGYRSFIVNSIRSARSKQSIAYFQPFTFLDLVIYINPNRDLQRISEYKTINSDYSVDIKKQTVLLFLAEVVDKLLRGEEENALLFSFIKESIFIFKSEDYQPNFHVQFLLKLTPYIGLAVLTGKSIYENMDQISDHGEIESYLQSLIETDFGIQIEVNGEIRNQALEVIIQYLQHHLDGFGKVQSLKVLAQIFR